MARTIIRLAEDQSRNVVFSLDEPRSYTNYQLMLTIHKFNITNLGDQKVLAIDAHGLGDGQEVAVGSVGIDDTLPDGLKDDVPYFVKALNENHIGLSKVRGGAAVPIHTQGSGELFAWLDQANLFRL